MTGPARSLTAMLLAWLRLRRSPAWRHKSLFLNRSSQSWRGPPAAPAFRNLFPTHRPHTPGALRVAHRACQLSLTFPTVKTAGSARQLSLSSLKPPRAARPLLLLLLASFLLFSPSLAYAQYSPGGACTTIGQATLTNTNPAYLLTCNSSNIWAMGEQFNATGQIGVGQTSIHAALDVNGGVRVGSDITCAVANAGEIIYTSGNVEYCNGSTWITFAASSTTLTGVDVLLLAGSAAAPSLTFQADTTTGLYQSTVDNLFVTTGGTERAVFDSSGNFDITNGSNTSAGGYQINASTVLALPDSGVDWTSIAVGKSALASQTANSLGNTAVGFDALEGTATGSYNTAVGYQALSDNTTGADSTAVGYGALNQATGSGNTALGFLALTSITTGTDSTAVGSNALESTTGGPNTAMGYEAMEFATTGTNNTALGNLAMLGNSSHALTGNYNTAIGDSALLAVTGAAADNTVLGYSAGTAVTSGGDNTLVGYESGYGVTTGTHNIILGEDPSSAITSGSSNILIGNSLSGLTATSNYQLNIGNVVTGTGLGTPSSSTVTIAGNFVVTGSCIGCTGGAALDNVDVELAAGSAAAPSLSFYADTNTGLYQAASHTINFSTNGTEVGAFDSSGNFDITNGSNTSAGGYQINATTVLALPDKDTSSIAVGQSALASQNGTSLYNTAIGQSALTSDTTGSSNTAVGNSALYYNSTGGENTALGIWAMGGASAAPLTGSFNTAAGQAALSSIQGSANGNAAFGADALGYNSTGSSNTAVGSWAMGGSSASPLTGDYNTAVGNQALSFIQGAAAENTALGMYALAFSTTSSYNTAVGDGAMQGTSAAPLTGGYNTAVGQAAFAQIQGSAADNTAFGYNAGYSDTTGTDNTLIGYEAGQGVLGSHNIILGEDPSSAITTGSGNILIGNSLANVTNSANQQLDIGDAIFATLSNGKVGIGTGTTAPAQTLEVNGTAKIDTGLIVPLIYPPSDSTTAIEIDKANGSTGVLDIDTTNGRVGIGTAAPAYTLDVAGTAHTTGTITIDSGTASSNATLKLTGRDPSNNPNSATIFADYNGGISMNPGNGSVGINLNPSSGANFQVGGTTALGYPANTVVSATNGLAVNGNVGIGTASPTQPLQVNGTILSTQAGGATVTLTSNNSASIDVVAPSNSATITTDRGSNTQGSGLILNTSGTEYAQFALDTSANSATIKTTNNTGLAVSSHNTNLTLAGGTSNGIIFQTNGGTEAMRIISSGSVGIANTSPGALLDIGTATSTRGTIRLEGSTSGYTQIQPNVTAGSWVMTLPANAGTSGYALTTDGSGNTSWTAAAAPNLNNVDIELAAGSAAAPSLSFAADTTTGLYQSTVDNLYVTTGGTERAVFDSSGDFNLTNTGGYGYQINGNKVLYLPDNDTTSIAVGEGALGSQSSTGLNNTAIGYEALNANTTGSGNVAIGQVALFANTTGTFNTAVGNNALRYSTSAANNAALGYKALYNNTTGSDNTAIGIQSLQDNVTGSGNTAVGYDALVFSTGSPNTALGANAGEYVTTGSDNIAIGYDAMVGTSANPLTAANAGNIAIGDNALTSITGAATSNVAIGYNALTSSTVNSTNPNTGVGTYALAYASTGTNNTAIGNLAMEGNSAHELTGDYNTAIGDSALMAITTAADDNTALGYKAGTAVTSGTDNTLVGYESGLGVSTGTHNIIVGEDPSSAITTGSSNILIGNSPTGLTAANNYQLNIGNVITGTGLGTPSSSMVTAAGNLTVTTGLIASLMYPPSDSTTAIEIDKANGTTNVLDIDTTNGRVGIGTTSPVAKLQVTANPSSVFGNNIHLWLDGSAGGGPLHQLGFGTNSSGVDDYPGAVIAGNESSYASDLLFGTRQNAAGNTEATERMRITSAGLVGIGNTAPGALLDIGTATSTLGTMRLEGSTSGYVQIQPNVTAGSWVMTLPPNAGSSGYALTTNGSGVTSWTAAAAPNLNNVDVELAAGSAAAPSLSFYSDTNTGMYQASSGSNTINFASAGAEVAAFDSTGDFNLTNAGGTSAGGYQINGNTVLALPDSGLDTGSIALGTNADPVQNTTGLYNTAIGHDALKVDSSGQNNTAIGAYALYDITTAQGNTAVGYQSLTYATSSYNTAVGMGAIGEAAETGADNTATGYYAMQANTSGTNNTAMGYEALYSNTSGASNVAIGETALYTNTSGSDNVAIGILALYTNSTSSNSTAIGTLALDLATGGPNTALGSGAGEYISTATDNIAIGASAMVSTSAHPLTATNAGNIAIGDNALESITGGATSNVAIGYNALTSSTVNSTNPNTAIGYEAMQYATSGTNNTALGNNAMLGASASPLTGDYNVALGDSALYKIEGGANNNIAIGYYAMGGQYAGSAATGEYNVAIGSNALNNITGGNDNTAVGYQAGAAITSGNNATAFGTNALYSLSTASGDTAIGFSALEQTTANPNTALGYEAGYYITSGTDNIAIGYQAMQGTSAHPVTGTDNTAIGDYALTAISAGGTDNTVLGYSAGTAVTSGTDNTLVGYESGKGVSTGAYNIILGEDPSSAITTGSSNILIGNSLTGLVAANNYQLNIGNVVTGTGLGAPSASTITIPGALVVTGGCTGCLGGSALDNIDIELAAGSAAAPSLSFYSDTNTGIYQASSGSYTINFASNGTEVAAFDSSGDFNLTTSTNSNVGGYQINGATILWIPPTTADPTGGTLAIGSGVLTSDTHTNIITGERNTGVGYQALYSNTKGYENTALGNQALYSITTSFANVAVGTEAEYYVMSIANTGIGFKAMYGASATPLTGSFNTAVGTQALEVIQGTATENTALGYGAGAAITTGNNNIGIGYSALNYTTTGSDNIGIGNDSLYATTTGTESVAIGTSALYNASGSPNTALGYEAGAYISSGTDNIAIGWEAMVGNNGGVTGSYNIAIGDNALYSITGGGTGNVAIGYNALTASTVSSTNPNTAIGTDALEYATTGTNNTAIGNLAMRGTSANPMTGGGVNVAIGDSALLSIGGSAVGNTAVGDDALYSLTTANANTAVGYLAGYAITTGTDNTLVGYEAGQAVTGTHNIILGEDLSSAITTGSSNILIGNSLTGLTNTSSNQLNIGNTIYGNLSTGYVGISTTTPAALLHVAGEVIIGNTGLACSATTAGAQRYDSVNNLVDYCNGTSWTALSQAAGPLAFSFTNQTGVNLSTTITSNTVTLTGFIGSLTATCSGCTAIAHNGVWGGTTVTGFATGDTIAIQVLSSASYGTAVTATATVGGTTSGTWTVTTTSTGPSAFSFTNVTGATTGITYTSNTVTLAGGFAGSLTATCSNCTGIALNGVWGVSPMTGFVNGSTIAIRQTSSSGAGVATTASVTVGTTTSGTWSVTTATACSVGITVGQACPDGTIYAGFSPDGSVPMYTTVCDSNQYWNGSACTACATGQWSGSGSTCNTTYSRAWNNGTSNWTVTGYTSATTGKANTAGLVALIDAGSPYNAANYCTSLSAYGHADFYLPAENELAVLYANKAAIANFDTTDGSTSVGGFYPGLYWTSTEGNNTSAWYQRFSDGYQNFTNKYVLLAVRCVRR